jgi:hypothetical protein
MSVLFRRIGYYRKYSFFLRQLALLQISLVSKKNIQSELWVQPKLAITDSRRSTIGEVSTEGPETKSVNLEIALTDSNKVLMIQRWPFESCGFLQMVQGFELIRCIATSLLGYHVGANESWAQMLSPLTAVPPSVYFTSDAQPRTKERGRVGSTVTLVPAASIYKLGWPALQHDLAMKGCSLTGIVQGEL